MEEDSQLSQRAESVSARSNALRDGYAHSGQSLCEHNSLRGARLFRLLLAFGLGLQPTARPS